LHPDRDDIKGLVVGALSGEAKRQLEEHMASCEFCREFAEDYRLQIESLKQAGQQPPPTGLDKLKERLWQQTAGIKMIRLSELKPQTAPASRLAADGRASRPRWQHLRTFYSESPEVVLRLMRDNEESRDYLQVIADDSSLYSFVAVDMPGGDVRLVTDENGCADIQPGLLDKAGDAAWQIRLPDAVFLLETLDYDPDKTESVKETILSTENDDKIRVVFEKKTEGKKISIEILQLDGRTDFDQVQVVLTADDTVNCWKATPKLGRTVTVTDKIKTINLRLFHS